MTEFVEAVKDSVRDIAASFTEEGDDFAPVLLFVNEDSISFVDQIQMPDEDWRKDIVADMMVSAMRGHHAIEAVFVSSTWVVTGGSRDDTPISAPFDPDYDDPLNGVRPSEHPDRREALILIHATRDSLTTHAARIRRRKGKPPLLGRFFAEENGLFQGRFPDAMRKGVTPVVS